MSAALKLVPTRIENPLGEKELKADDKVALSGDGRAIAVAKFRELAGQLERGELDGARVQWRRQSEAELAAKNPSEMVTVTVSADADHQVGTVQLLTYSIEES